jgi:hypothetical protein
LQALEEKGAAAVAGLKTYEVDVNGTTASLRLSDADAKARGLLKAEPAKPAAGSKPAADKTPDATAAKQAAAPLNKSRDAAKK